MAILNHMNIILPSQIQDEHGCLVNSTEPETFTYSELKSLETTVQDATKVSGNGQSELLTTLRKSLLERHMDRKSFISQSELFQPSQNAYSDVPDEHSRNTLLRCHRTMIRLREMDDILSSAQRQGRISFYLTCRGEEAMTIGSASALKSSDVLLTQYREQGLFMWRGFTLEQFTNQVSRTKLLTNYLYHVLALTFMTVDSVWAMTWIWAVDGKQSI